MVHAILVSLAADPATNAALQGIVLVSIADFVLGSLKSVLGSHTFDIKWFDAWVGDHLLKALTIAGILVFGRIAPDLVVGDFHFNVFAGAGIGAAATYVATVGASVVGNLNFGSADPAPSSTAP